MRQGTSMKRAMLVGIGVATMVTTLTAASAKADPIAYWKMDETTGSGASDSSLNGHNGTLTNEATWDSTGKYNGAVALDGLNDYVDVPSAADLKYTGGNMTLSAWVYIDPTEVDSGCVISKPWNGNGRYNYILSIGTGATSDVWVNFSLANADWNNTKDYYIATAAIPSFKSGWHHLAAVVDSSRNMKIYVDATDGIADASGVHDIMDFSGMDYPVPLALGTLYPYGASGWAYSYFSVDGKLDDVAIFGRALEGWQIAGLASGIWTPLNVVPEPATGVLLGSGLVLIGLLAAAQRRRTRRAA